MAAFWRVVPHRLPVSNAEAAMRRAALLAIPNNQNKWNFIALRYSKDHQFNVP